MTDDESFALLRLPERTELILFLLKEDLRNYKLMRTLRQAGFNSGSYDSDLGILILTYVGLFDEGDEAFCFYFDLLEKHCTKMDTSSNVMMEQALEIYVALMARKEKKDCAQG